MIDFEMLTKAYDKMTDLELTSLGVFYTTALDGAKEYFHSGFSDCSKSVDDAAALCMKLSIESEHRMREKGKSHHWTADEMAGYAYEIARAMEKESKKDPCNDKR